MIKGKITLSGVNYGESIKNLFPLIMEKLSAIQDPNVVVRFLNRLGENALPIALDILAPLPEEEKVGIVAAAVNQFQGRICTAANGLLKDNSLDSAIRLVTVSAETHNKGLEFLVYCTDPNYRAIAESKLAEKLITGYVDGLGEKMGFHGGGFLGNAAKSVLKMSIKTALGQMGKKGPDIICRKDVNRKISDLLSDGLCKFGLVATVESVELEQDIPADMASVIPEENAGFSLSKEIEESLMDAVVSYLKRADGE